MFQIDQYFVVGEFDQGYVLGIVVGQGDFVDMCLYQGVLVGNQYDFFVFLDLYCGDQCVVVFVGDYGDYFLVVMVVMWEFVQWGMFVEVVFGGGEDLCFGFWNQYGDQLLFFVQVYVMYVVGVVVYDVYYVFGEVDYFVGVGEQYDFFGVIGDCGGDQGVVFFQFECDQVVVVWMVELYQWGFFYGIEGGGYEDVGVGWFGYQFGGFVFDFFDFGGFDYFVFEYCVFGFVEVVIGVVVLLQCFQVDL